MTIVRVVRGGNMISLGTTQLSMHVTRFYMKFYLVVSFVVMYRYSEDLIVSTRSSPDEDVCPD